MKLASFHVGLHLKLNNVQYSIERIYESGECILERLNDHALVQRTKSELIKLFAEGSINLDGETENKKSNNDRSTVDLASLSDEQQKEVIRKKEYILAAQKMLGEKPTTIDLSYVINQVGNYLSEENLPSISSVIRWWKKWISSGNDVLSLVDKKPGLFKARKLQRETGKIIREVIEDNYLTIQRTSVQDVYDLLCYRVSEINRIRTVPLKIPSRATFYRIINDIDCYECLAAREGKHIADKHFRAVGAGVTTEYILERVEVDHTPLDVMVVNERTGLVDGRPWLTVLLDRHSRMPLGIEIGFEPPSEISVMNALRNAIRPKINIKKINEDILNEWPAFGIPTTLICDNGAEFHSKNLKRICAELNIELQFCPKKQPNYKGAVERFLGTLNRAISHRIPGTTFSNINHRSDYQAEKLARITLLELKSFIYEWIIDIYNFEVNRITQKTPYELWSQGLQYREPMLPESMHQLNLILSKELERKLTHEGVQIFGLIYNSRVLGELRKRAVNTYTVKIRFDASDLSHIHVYDDMNGDYIKVQSIYPEYTNNLSLLEHKSIKSFDKSNINKIHDLALPSLLKKKAEFSEKLKKLSTSKKIRPRQKAERYSLHKDISKKEKIKISELNKQESLNFNGIILEEIPRFDTSKRGDY